MKVVSFLNVSNLQRLSCDSGLILQKLMAVELLKRGHQFTFVSPASLPGVTSPLYKHIPLSLGDHKFQVRYFFPWHKVEEILREEQPDIIWINQPELAPAFRAVLTSLGSSSKLVVYLHYFPYEVNARTGALTVDPSQAVFGDSPLVPLAFLTGVLASDVVLIHSEYARTMLLEGLEHFRLPLSEGTQIEVLPPPLDPALVTKNTRPFEELKTIVYNHRLYTQYGTATFIEYLQRGALCAGHELRVMDILGIRSAERQKLDRSVETFREQLTELPNTVIDLGGCDRAHYQNILSSTKFAIAPFRASCTWSMSVVDCLAAGIPVMAPEYAFFSELVPKQCLHDGTFESFSALSDRLSNDRTFWAEMSEKAIARVKHLSPERVVSSFLRILSPRSHNKVARLPHRKERQYSFHSPTSTQAGTWKERISA